MRRRQLNPHFTWSCFDSGAGPICKGTFESSYENEPHLPDGRATKTITNLGYPEDRLSLSPTGDGPSLVVRGHWNRRYTYTVPGARSSRVLTEVGAVYVALERAVCDHLT